MGVGKHRLDEQDMAREVCQVCNNTRVLHHFDDFYGYHCHLCHFKHYLKLTANPFNGTPFDPWRA